MDLSSGVGGFKAFRCVQVGECFSFGCLIFIVSFEVYSPEAITEATAFVRITGCKVFGASVIRCSQSFQEKLCFHSAAIIHEYSVLF